MARHIGPGNGKTFARFGWPRKMAVPSPKIKWKDKGESSVMKHKVRAKISSTDLLETIHGYETD